MRELRWLVLAVGLVWFAMRALGAGFSLNAQGRLCVDNSPMLPVGLYSVPITNMPAVHRQSFNTIVDPYWAQGAQSTPKHLAAARTNGFFLIPGFPYEKTRAKDEPYFERYVQTTKDDDRLLVWNLFEEPSGTHITVEQGEWAYQTLRRFDRTRPALFVDFKQEHVAAYRNCYDIFAYDYYPIGTGPIVYWRNLLRKAIETARPKSVWAVIQAFGHDDPKKDWVLPTADEMRCMAYAALLSGAQGILFYAYSQKDPGHWAALQHLGAELMSLAPVLLAPAADDRVSADPPRLDLTLRTQGAPGHETLHVIAANVAHKTPTEGRHFPGVRQANVRIRINGLSAARAELVGEAGTGSATAGRVVPIIGGVLTDSFDPYAVHIYKIVNPSGAR